MELLPFVHGLEFGKVSRVCDHCRCTWRAIDHLSCTELHRKENAQVFSETRILLRQLTRLLLLAT